MINAREARRISTKNARLYEIFSLIKEAAEDGKFAIHLSMSDWLMYGNDLNDKGFKGRPSSGNNELCVRVSW